MDVPQSQARPSIKTRAGAPIKPPGEKLRHMVRAAEIQFQSKELNAAEHLRLGIDGDKFLPISQKKTDGRRCTDILILRAGA